MVARAVTTRLLAACLVLIALLARAPCQVPAHDLPHRGALVYGRNTLEFAVQPPPSRLRFEWVVRGDREPGVVWRHHQAARDALPAGFEQPGFDDSAWPAARGGFGPEPQQHANHRTAWRSDELAVRLRLDLGQRKPRALLFSIDHDDGVKVWLNGQQLVADNGYGSGREYVLMGAPLDAWQRGENLLAARCTNTGGWQQFDLSMAQFQTLPPGVKTVADLQQLLREEREQADRVRRELFGAFRAPALLLQGELDATGTQVRIPPGDLRDLGWWLAMNLGVGLSGGTLQLDAYRMFRLGDLACKGRAAAVDAEGWQVLEFTVKSSAEPAPREDSKRFVDRFVKPHVWYGFDGNLMVRRRLELRGNRAVVAEFQSELQGRFLRGKEWKEHVASLQQREHWQLTTVRDNQDAAFRTAVKEALERGTDWLKGQVRNLKHADLADEAADAPRSYHSGRLALALLALVKGGVPKDDPVVVAGFAELRRRKLIDTYSLGNALMALEALYAPPSEFGDLKEGVIDRPRKRQPDPKDLELMKRWSDQLLQNVDTRVNASKVLRFNYVRGARYDQSLNQYGLLGLYSAHLCGVDIAPTVWEAAIQHLMAAQSPGGSRLDLDLVDYRTHARRQADPEGRHTGSRLVARTAGWNYEDPKSDGELSPVWGSMTCAGITGLAVSQAALFDHGPNKRVALLQEATRARHDGFAWLAQHLTVRCHAGAIERQQLWFYYFLYGLERAALLSGVALLQDRDWYFEGAMVLTAVQNRDGSWPVELVRYADDRLMDDTAMAILFLKQSTLPVLTGR